MTTSRRICRLYLYPSILFGLFLAWFYFLSPWYPAATLTVTGKTSEPTATIGVRFDSGHGLNGYELEKFPLKSRPQEANEILLRITRTGDRNPASLSDKITLGNVLVDGEILFPPQEQLPPEIQTTDKGLVFSKDGASLEFWVKINSSLQLDFPSSNNVGIVQVQVGEDVSRHDLYATNDERQWAGRRAKIVSTCVRITPFHV